MKLFFWGMMVQVFGGVAAIVVYELTRNPVLAFPFIALMIIGAVLLVATMILESKSHRQMSKIRSQRRRSYCDILEGYIRDN